MKKFMFVALAMILTLSAFTSVAPTPPVDTTRVLDARLSGPAIDGVAPSGKAEFVASQGGTSFDIGMFNLNLPDGTCLDIAFGRAAIHAVAVIRGSASFRISPSPEEIHVAEDITISIGEPLPDQTQCGGVLPPATATVLAPVLGTVILSGTFQEGSGTK